MKALIGSRAAVMVAVIALAMATGSQDPALAVSFESSTARIAAWNLEGYNPIPDERLARQAEALAILDAEIVALVEINPHTRLADLEALLESMGMCYDSKVINQNRQDIGVLYKCGITATNPRLIPGSDLGSSSARKAFVVDMTVGKFDFMLIAVHFKSSRSKTSQEIRDDQTQVVGAFIANEVQLSDRTDILLVGDFNMIPGQDVSNFHHLGGDDNIDFLSSWDLQDEYSHILSTGRANLLDGFAITRVYTTEYIRGSLRVFPMHWAMDIGLEKYRTTISDHLPFVASFKITKDSD